MVSHSSVFLLNLIWIKSNERAMTTLYVVQSYNMKSGTNKAYISQHTLCTTDNIRSLTPSNSRRKTKQIHFSREETVAKPKQMSKNTSNWYSVINTWSHFLVDQPWKSFDPFRRILNRSAFVRNAFHLAYTNSSACLHIFSPSYRSVCTLCTWPKLPRNI